MRLVIVLIGNHCIRSITSHKKSITIFRIMTVVVVVVMMNVCCLIDFKINHLPNFLLKLNFKVLNSSWMHWNWTTPLVDLDSHAMNASLRQEKQYNKLSYKQQSMMSLLKIFLEFKKQLLLPKIFSCFASEMTISSGTGHSLGMLRKVFLGTYWINMWISFIRSEMESSFLHKLSVCGRRDISFCSTVVVFWLFWFWWFDNPGFEVFIFFARNKSCIKIFFI